MARFLESYTELSNIMKNIADVKLRRKELSSMISQLPQSFITPQAQPIFILISFSAKVLGPATNSNIIANTQNCILFIYSLYD